MGTQENYTLLTLREKLIRELVIVQFRNCCRPVCYPKHERWSVKSEGATPVTTKLPTGHDSEPVPSSEGIFPGLILMLSYRALLPTDRYPRGFWISWYMFCLPYQSYTPKPSHSYLCH